MSSVVINGDTSGSITLQAPAVAGTNTLTLPALTGTVALNGPAFSAYANAATSLSNNAYTKVLFQVAEFDTNSNYASSRFTPTVAGYYQINATVGASASIGTTGQSLINIYKNGTKYKSGLDINGVNTISWTISSLVYLNGSTDYVEIYVYQQSGGAINTASSIADTWFNGVLVRSA